MTAILDFHYVSVVLNRFKSNQKQTKHAKTTLIFQITRKKRRNQDQESTPRSRSGGKVVSAFGVPLKLSCRVSWLKVWKRLLWFVTKIITEKNDTEVGTRFIDFVQRLCHCGLNGNSSGWFWKRWENYLGASSTVLKPPKWFRNTPSIFYLVCVNTAQHGSF